MNIKILICFIIICFIPAASAGNNVWVAKSSGFVKSNGSISFENYLVRATALDDTKASVTVYRDKAKVETSDFSINEFKKYDAIGVTLLGIKGDYSWIAISKFENKEFWRPLATMQLKWGEKYMIENYTFNFDTFGSDSVNLTVSNKSMVETKFFPAGGMKDYEALRVIIRDINRTGFIDLEFFTNKPPTYRTEVFPFIKARVLTDKDEYFPDEPIQASAEVSSDFALNAVGVLVESSSPVEVSPDSFSATDVSGTQSFQSKITRQPENSTVTINAKIEVRDYDNNSYVINAGKDIFVTPEVAIVKSVQADTDDENVPIQLYIYNSANDSRTVHILDTIPAELGAKALNWTVELGPKNSTSLEYNITPVKPGLYFLPPATAQWNDRSIASKRVKTTMHMPYISMTKSAEVNGSQTDVKLVIANIGDRPAQVRASDRLPAGHSVLSGVASWSDKLEPGERATITYSLQGELSALPAASATYRDIRGVTRFAQSNAVNAGTSAPDRKENAPSGTIPLNLKPEEIILFMVASFLAIAGIIAGAALVAYAITKVRS